MVPPTPSSRSVAVDSVNEVRMPLASTGMKLGKCFCGMSPEVLERRRGDGTGCECVRLSGSCNLDKLQLC